MDVDKMFDLPKLGSQKNKRKFTDSPTPEMLSKMSKTEHENNNAANNEMGPPPIPSSSKGKQRATVEDVDDEDDGPLPQDNGFDEQEDAGEDEDQDGRFYGGGLTSEQQTILQIMDKDTGEHGDDDSHALLTLPRVRKMLTSLQKSITTNQEMRVKFADDPTRFIDSEFALDSAIRNLVLLTQDPASFYPEFVKLKIVQSLVDLLLHENTDISISLVEVLEELTDEDVGEREEDEIVPQEEQDKTEGIRNLIESFMQHAMLPSLFQHLTRLNEEDETERNAVYHTLSLIENLISAYPPVSYQIIKETKILPWLTERIQKKKGKDDTEDLGLQNKQYAAEVLSIILQGGTDDNETANVRDEYGKLGGIDALLLVLTTYRRHDPKDAEEIEFMENIFNALCLCLLTGSNKRRFLELEGVELMIIIMKEKKMAHLRAVRVLDHALATEDGAPSCKRFIEYLGLKSLFSIFMHSDNDEEGTTKKKKLRKLGRDAHSDEHMFGVIASLFSNLDSDSQERLRLLAKFVELEYSKVDRLLEFRSTLSERVLESEARFREEIKLLEDQGLDISEDEAYMIKLDAGLFSLQLVDYILAWICMEDDGIRDHVSMLLRRNGNSFADVVQILKEYKENIGDGDNVPSEESGKDKMSPGARQRDIISHLIEYLEAM